MIDTTKHAGNGKPEPSAYLLFIDTKSKAYWQPLPEGMPNYIQAWRSHLKADESASDSKWLLSAFGSALDDWMFQDWESEIAVDLEYCPRDEILNQLLNAIEHGFHDLDQEVSLFEIASILRIAVKNIGEQFAGAPNA